MRKHIPFFLNNLTVWVLVAILTGCGGGEDGGSDQNQSATQKPDNAKGGQAAKGPETPKAVEKPAEKFTPEMVKAALEPMDEAFEAMKKKFPDLPAAQFGVSYSDLSQKELDEMTEMINKQISNGKIDSPDLKVDKITVEALSKGMLEAFEAELPKLEAALAKLNPEESKEGWDEINKGHATTVANGFEFYAKKNEGKFPAAENWSDAILKARGPGIWFYSPQHPDTLGLQSVDKAAEDDKADADKVKRGSHYAFNKVLSGKNVTDDISGVVMVFECDLGWNGAGGLEDALKYMDKFKLEKIAVVTAGMDVRAVTKEELKKLKWVPKE